MAQQPFYEKNKSLLGASLRACLVQIIYIIVPLTLFVNGPPAPLQTEVSCFC